MRKTLLVTNDFPPRAGGIQTFLEGFVGELDPEQLIVYASTPPDSESASGAEVAKEYDADQPYDVVRYPGTMMLPTPDVKHEMQRIIREREVKNVWFGAATPLGLLANAAREAGADRVISTTHGHEIGWSMIPGARQILRKVFRDADIVTYLTEATYKRLEPFIGDTEVRQLHGAINPEQFTFNESAHAELRERYGLGDAPVVVCISRLVERKGQDRLIQAWPSVVANYPEAKLVIVGKGPYGETLREMARNSPVSSAIVFTGEVPYSELAAHYSLGDVFAMPVRTRGNGLDIEGLGIVYLEAYAAGLPVIAGNSGGAPEAVRNGETGLVINGNYVPAVVGAVNYFLSDPDRAKAMGEAGRTWVDEKWRWSDVAVPLIEALS
ncbi:phosphatidylinositol alpha-1,6-mannosyltransferase [Trueperella bonasi]|uniref:Phosphatidylinositol alpha-1,6-mannosyltransferase n=1 Tax=Trueperella bonasi TaxID=312286 RepID=A0ABT9NEC0_9ACTO|nr:glycosyltransferase family 4 protein [Trueperella bonasi]MDP9805694.1 phosphatidylinositol alpha-1,6-mannosyltransferase [Trueperella bonasi]